MREVFADTSYWIVLLNPRDELHAKAIAMSRKLSEARLVTSEMVLAELLNGFPDGGPRLRLAGVSAVEAVRHFVIVFPQTTEQFRRALSQGFPLRFWVCGY